MSEPKGLKCWVHPEGCDAVPFFGVDRAEPPVRFVNPAERTLADLFSELSELSAQKAEIEKRLSEIREEFKRFR